jgi:hypothetical protein
VSSSSRRCAFIGSSFACGSYRSSSRRTLSFRDHFRDPGHSSSPEGLWTGVRKVGVIRHWDFSLLAGVEGRDCGFVGACPAFPVTAGRERQVTPPRLAREHALRRPACSCAANARISPGATSVSCRSTPGGETARPSHQSVSNPFSRVSAALSQRLCAGGINRLEESQKHALTGENRVNGNEITLC